MSKFLTPLSILISGLIIAVALLLSGGNFAASFFSGLVGQKSAAPARPEKPSDSPVYPAAPPSPLPSVNDLGTNPPLGPATARVKIIEFGDFQCPYCDQFFRNVEASLRKEFVEKGSVIFAFRDLAFLGPESLDAALAARCAGEQGRYWDYHDKLFESQRGENRGAFAPANLKKFAQSLGLNREKFRACFDSRRFDSQVRSDTVAAQSAGVNVTPTVFVNGQVFSDWSNYNLLKQTINSLL